MSGDYLDRLLQLDLKTVTITITGALRNPSSNITVFALTVGAIAIIVLLIILALVAAFAWGDDEDDEAEGEAGEQGTPAAKKAAPVPLAEEPERVPKLVAGLLWLAAFGLVWIAGGYASGRDAICVSCHLEGGPHITRYEDPAADPHTQTSCVECHETPNAVASVTTAVPGRAFHMLGGLALARAGRGYGIPVSNRNCLGCHEQVPTEVVEDDVRGLRVSHKEPLEAKALCSDCHELHAATGVVDQYTVGMDPCLRCHDEEAASANCDLCHTKDIAYAVQANVTMTPKQQIENVDCGGCHSQEKCDACHGMRMPHSAAFKGVAHARAAAEDHWFNDGKLCKRCHTDTRHPCYKCHKKPFPGHPIKYMVRAHKTTDPYNNGCGSCHDQMSWIVGRNFCGNCHPEYEPSALGKGQAIKE